MKPGRGAESAITEGPLGAGYYVHVMSFSLQFNFQKTGGQ